MAIILGIDPGSRITGYGVIDSDGFRDKYVASGCIRATNKEFSKQLQRIFTGITEVVNMYKPQKTAIEQVFMHINVNSALKLGRAQGAAIAALVAQNLSVAEYSARQVKQAVVGYGAASKSQVQHMVKTLLNLECETEEDAADALAIAICHAHTLKKGVSE
jgi:crossover junction endodeoxyribonuclease RuvC